MDDNDAYMALQISVESFRDVTTGNVFWCYACVWEKDRAIQIYGSGVYRDTHATNDGGVIAAVAHALCRIGYRAEKYDIRVNTSRTHFSLAHPVLHALVTGNISRRQKTDQEALRSLIRNRDIIASIRMASDPKSTYVRSMLLNSYDFRSRYLVEKSRSENAVSHAASPGVDID